MAEGISCKTWRGHEVELPEDYSFDTSGIVQPWRDVTTHCKDPLHQDWAAGVAKICTKRVREIFESRTPL
jgi:hypothetical protein